MAHADTLFQPRINRQPAKAIFLHLHYFLWFTTFLSSEQLEKVQLLENEIRPSRELFW